MINIKDLDNYESIYFILHEIQDKSNHKSILSKFKQRQQILNKLEELRINNSELSNIRSTLFGC